MGARPTSRARQAILLTLAACALVGGPRASEAVRAEPEALAIGHVPVGEERTVSFELVNDSERDVQLIRFRSTCRCLAVTGPPPRVPAGGRVTVTARFAAPDEPVAYDRQLWIYTSDPAQPKFALGVTARVGLPLSLEPAALDFGTLAAGEVRRVPVTVRNAGPADVRIACATASADAVVARVPADPVPAGGTLAVPVEIAAGRDAGPQRQTLTLHTSAPHQGTLSVPVTLTVDPAYEVAGGWLDAGRLAPGQAATATATIRRRQGEGALVVERIGVVEATGGTVTAEPTVAGDTLTVTAHIQAGAEPGPLGGAVEVWVAGRATPIGLPIRGQVLAPAATPAALPQEPQP